MGKKNSWFKHYNTASSGHLLGNLISNKQYEAALLWWIILEIVSRFEDQETRGECHVPLSRIARVMNMTQPRVRSLLGQLTVNSPSSHDCTLSASQPYIVSIKIHNWLELQENRGGKRDAKNDQKGLRSKRLEVRGKKEDVEIEESKDSSSTVVVIHDIAEADKKPSMMKEIQVANEGELITEIPSDTLERWSRIYPDADYLQREVLKAFNYYKNNPKKLPRTLKGWINALGSWFDRGWPKHVAQIGSQPDSHIDWDFVFKRKGANDVGA